MSNDDPKDVNEDMNQYAANAAQKKTSNPITKSVSGESLKDQGKDSSKKRKVRDLFKQALEAKLNDQNTYVISKEEKKR